MSSPSPKRRRKRRATEPTIAPDWGATQQRLTTIEQRQAEQDARLAALEARIAQMERDAAKQVPWPWPAPTPDTSPTYPPLYPQWPQMPDNSDDARCPVCQMRYKDLTHYVCNHPQCPSRITYTLGDPVVPGQPGYTHITCGGSERPDSTSNGSSLSPSS